MTFAKGTGVGVGTDVGRESAESVGGISVMFSCACMPPPSAVDRTISVGVTLGVVVDVGSGVEVGTMTIASLVGTGVKVRGERMENVCSGLERRNKKRKRTMIRTLALPSRNRGKRRLGGNEVEEFVRASSAHKNANISSYLLSGFFDSALSNTEMTPGGNSKSDGNIAGGPDRMR